MGETVTSAYIHSHLRTSEQEVLKRPLYGGDLTDNTYQDCIIARSKRFFLILVATGIPDQIFGILDDCLDDDDLPIAEGSVPSLRLSREPDKALDKRFYRTQFRYLTRIIAAGEHIRYADEEIVPVVPLGLKSVIPSLNRDGVDTVKLPSDSSRVFIRRKVSLDSKTTEEQVLSEIAEMKRFSHEHVVSVFGSYLQSGVMTVLSSPAPEYTLKSFLNDSPKAFEALGKSERRRILINWPHCLANATAFLHQNGGHHGAIRPSNIHISHTWQISLGQLDGEGILCSSIKADDLDAYTYHPPERWKRAVTVQSTGSERFGLLSRSARKVEPEHQDPLDPSSRKRSGSGSGGNPVASTAYAFLPASKSEFSRFRLSTAVDATALIPPPPRRNKDAASGDSNSTNSRGTGRTPTERDWTGRAASVLSSNSSEGRRRTRAAFPGGIFLAARESRSAVVQTWKSVQHDSFAADVFSLAAVIMEILTVLCKKSSGSFTRHRSAKNRNAGRGGGLADASFHANLGQVLTWAQTLSNEAEKKVKKDDSQVLRAVGAVLQVTVQCLERKPELRLKSDVFEEKLGDHIKKFANIDPLHCILVPVEQPKPIAPQPPTLEPSMMASFSTRFGRARSRTREESIPEDEELYSRPSTTMSHAARPNTSRTVMPTTTPPAVSLRSMPSMSLDMDERSERSERSGTVMGSTVVGSITPSREQSVRNYRRAVDNEARDRAIQAWAVADISPQKPDRFDYTHSNDSDVDPQLRLSTDTNQPGVFTYMNYSPTTSEDEEVAAPFMYPIPPQTRPPTRDLPPVPAKSPSQARRSHIVSQTAVPSHARPVMPSPAISRGPSRDEIEMLQKLSRGIPGAQRPLRTSSRYQGYDPEYREEELYPPQLAQVPRASSPHRVQSDRQKERMYRQRAWNNM